jgi:uncharacterized membrane protein YkgB
MDRVNWLFESAARLDRVGISVTRVGLVVVLVWIGSLKVFHYEADGIVPFVANSPFMKSAYQQSAGEYRKHMNREGELVPPTGIGTSGTGRTDSPTLSAR